MTFRTLTAALAAALLSLGVQAQAPAETPSPAPTATSDAPRSVELKVDGLVCAFCAQGISKRLSKMDATQDVFVSLENGLVAVALKPGQDLADETLRTALTEAGYTVRSIERKAETLEAVRARLRTQP